MLTCEPPPETGLDAFLGQFGEAMFSLKLPAAPGSGPPPADPDPMDPPGEGAELWGLPGGGPALTGNPPGGGGPGGPAGPGGGAAPPLPGKVALGGPEDGV